MALSDMGYFFFYVGWTPSLTSLPFDLDRDPEGITEQQNLAQPSDCHFSVRLWDADVCMYIYIFKFMFSSLTSKQCQLETVIYNVNNIGFKYTKIIAVGLRYTY